MSRRLHLIGTVLAVALALAAVVTEERALLWGVPSAGYALAWTGHFLFEANASAIFPHPLHSLRGDFTILRDVPTGRLRW